MASKEQIQKALDHLYEKYGNTLQMLSDAVDKIDDLENQLEKSTDVDIDLSAPKELKDLEKLVLSRIQPHEEK